MRSRRAAWLSAGFSLRRELRGPVADHVGGGTVRLENFSWVLLGTGRPLEQASSLGNPVHARLRDLIVLARLGRCPRARHHPPVARVGNQRGVVAQTKARDVVVAAVGRVALPGIARAAAVREE